MPVRFPYRVAHLAVAATIVAGSVGATTRIAAQPAPAGSATRLVLDSLDLGAVTTLSELLQARVPGLIVQSGSGVAGAGVRVSARGRRTLMGDTDPLIVVDGVRRVYRRRMLSSDSALAVSPLDDLPVEQIAVVEVLPGVAAAGRYGPGAQNGAIVVTTRRAAPGRTRVTGYSEGGAASGSEQRALWRGVGRTTDGRVITDCDRSAEASRFCTLDRVEQWDPYGAVPWRTGARARLGASVAGGGERLAVRGSIDGARAGGTLDGNDASQGAARVALDVTPAPGLRLFVDALGALQRADGTPGGLGSYTAYNGAWQPARLAADGSWKSRRIDANAALTWTPTRWLELHATGGTSTAKRDEGSTLTRGPFETTAPLDPTFSGIRTTRTGDARDRVTTADAGVAGSWRPGTRTRVRTGVGVQLIDQRRREHTLLRNENLGAGVAGEEHQLREVTADVRAAYLSQQIAIASLTVDGVLRADRIEGGTLSESMISGSGTVAWRALSRGARTLDLRAAYGSSGSPVPVDPVYEIISIGIGGVPTSELPNPGLPFERTREAEVGIDVAWSPALRGSVTAYEQRVSGLVLTRVIPSSVGFRTELSSTGTRVTNRGVELALGARVVERPGYGLTVGARAWASRSTTSLDQPPGALPQQGERLERYALLDGEPLVVYWGAKDVPALAGADANGDGLLSAAEVASAVNGSENGGARTPYGVPDPTRAAAVDAQLRLGRRVTLSTVVEHRSGHLVTAGDVGAYFFGQQGLYDPAATVDAQADALLAQMRPETTLRSGAMTRLRELALSYRLGGIAGARSTTLTLAGRNLLTRTAYEGLDPEGDVNAASAFARASAVGVPLPRTVALRVTAEW